MLGVDVGGTFTDFVAYDAANRTTQVWKSLSVAGDPVAGILRGLEQFLTVKADQIVGQSVDIFHKVPTHQRRILSDPKKLPHRARIKLGTETLDLSVAAIMDKDGSYIGPMLSWSVITEQVKLAERVASVVDAVAGASTELRTTAESMAATAEETARQANAVAAARPRAPILP